MSPAPASSPVYVVLLSDAALSDDLLVRSFGRMLAGSNRRVVLVHGDGGTAARAFEAAAVFDASDAQAAQARTQATYALSRKLAAQWSDEGAVLTGLSGEGRAVFSVDEAGALTARPAQVEALLAQGVVPLVAARARRPDGTLASVSEAAAAAALARALGATGVVIARHSLPGGRPRSWPLAAQGEVDAQADAMDEGAFYEAGIPSILTSAAKLFGPGEIGPTGA